MATPSILHLSDLHFRAGDPKGDQRDIVLAGALEVIRALGASEVARPGLVCITGDIAAGGTREDYDLAQGWLEEVRDALGLSFDDFALCPGNHDVERREAKYLIRPISASDADPVFIELLREGNEHDCFEDSQKSPIVPLRPFQEYIRFCHRIGLPPLNQGESREGYLWGVRTHKGVRLIVLNSAWFAKDEKDDRHMHIGLSLLERLKSKCGMDPIGQESGRPLSVALLHHPRDWLAEECRSAYPHRPAEWEMLSRSAHIILHGHTHEPRGKVSLYHGEALVIPAGSIEGGIRFPNRIHLLHAAETGRLRRTSWSLDMLDASHAWRQDPDEVPATLSGFKWNDPQTAPVGMPDLLSVLREDAVEFVRGKQYALHRREGMPLPQMRLVRDLSSETPPDRTGFQKPVQLVTLQDATRATRLVILVGEMGAGKSTLCGLSALLELEAGRPSVVLSLRGLAFPVGMAPGAVWEQILNVASSQSPALAGLAHKALDQLLGTSLLALDGLDEMSHTDVDQLLRGCESAARSRPTLRVLVSGRPGALEPRRYRLWRLVATQVLEAREVAEIVSTELGPERQPDADLIVARLKESPVLSALVTTPLLARMLARALAQNRNLQVQTSGDLLRLMCLERLGEWDRREARKAVVALDAVWPDPQARVRALGQAFLRARGQEMDRAGLVDRLVADAHTTPHTRSAALTLVSLAEEAGLVTYDPLVQVTSHRIAEYLLGEGIAEHLVRAEPVALTTNEIWREWSYAAASLRHRGQLSANRDALDEAVHALLSAGNPAGAAYVIWESQDHGLAKRFVEHLRVMGPRPMSVWWDERADSARAAASAVILAGNVGFEWFVEAYLNPYLPDPWTGSAVEDALIDWWCRLCDPRTLGPEKVDRLWDWAQPRLQYCGPYRDMRLAAVCSLIPAEFPLAARINLLRDLLASGTLGARAEELIRTEFAGPHAGNVQVALQARVGSSEAPAFASACLWLALHPEGIVPAIIDGVLGAGRRGDQNARWLEAVGECRRRLGEGPWRRYLRWSLYRAGDAARGAALALFLEGERSVAVLGWPLLHAMHEGAPTPGAESAFDALLKESGEPGWLWFHARMMEAAQGGLFDGPHAGWWRVFLRRLASIGAEGIQPFIGALRGLCQFVLPRQADVRETIAALLNGPQGAAYREAVTACLKSFDASVRVAAAATLAISTSEPEVEVLMVLLIAVRGAIESPLQNHWEWVDMLTGLRWSAVAIAKLRMILHELPKEARSLALLLMDVHDVVLSIAEQRELAEAPMTGLIPDSQAAHANRWFAGEQGRGRLLEVMLQGGDARYSAANALLRLHVLDLPLAVRAQAALLGVGWATQSAELLRREILYAMEDDTYASALMDVDARQRGAGSTPAPVARVLAAIRSGEGWPEILAQVYGLSHSFGGGGDEAATTSWLLDLARVAGVSQFIADAAAWLLSEPKGDGFHRRSVRPWLAILADDLSPGGTPALLRKEFHQANQDSMRDPRPAMLARLRRHEGAKTSRAEETAPLPCETAIRSFGQGLSPDVARLRLLANDTESRCRGATQLLRVAALTFKDGDENPVPAIGQGYNHALLRGAAEFILFGRMAPEVVVPVFPFGFLNPGQDDHDLRYIIDIWRHVHRRGLLATPQARGQVEAGLRDRLRNDQFEAPAIAFLMMELDLVLADEEMERVLCRVASWSFRDPFGVVPHLARWLERHSERDIVRGMLQRAIALADVARQREDSFTDVALGPMFLCALYWTLGGTEREMSGRVAVRALESLWNTRRSRDRHDEDPDPAFRLLTQVPGEILHDVLRRGVREGSPAAGAMCSLLLAGPLGTARPLALGSE